jgi:hypothetical protein
MKNNKKIILAVAVLLLIPTCSYLIDLQKSKVDCDIKIKQDQSMTDQIFYQYVDENEKLKNQILANELALEQAHKQIMLLKVQCKNCQYILTSNEN